MNQLVVRIIQQTDEQVRVSNDMQKKRFWSQMALEKKVEHALKVIRQMRMKDWRLVPPEIKIMYIKLLDFPERLKLRITASNERALVDSLSIDFPSVDFNSPKASEVANYGFGRYRGYRGRYRRPRAGTMGTMNVRYPIRNSEQRFGDKILRVFDGKTYTSAINFLAYVLKIGKIDEMKIYETYSPDRFDRVMKVLEKSAPFKIKQLDIVAKKAAVECFLKNSEGLEQIKLNAEASSDFPIDDFLKIRSFINAKMLTIQGLCLKDAPAKLAEKWIENDTEVGAKLHASVGEYGLQKFVETFVEKYSEKIIAHDDQTVRIGTENPAKHILLKLIIIPEGYGNEKGFISCSIIPSKLKESEYDNDIQWTDSLEYGHGELWDVPVTYPGLGLDTELMNMINSMSLSDMSALGIGRGRRRVYESDDSD